MTCSSSCSKLAPNDSSIVTKRFTVVLRAPTPLVFPEGEGFRVTDVPTPHGPATVSYTSRWIQASKTARLPGQLWIEVIGFAPDINSAVPALANVGLGALSAISLAGNVAIEHPAIELAFETDPSAKEREFFQAFVRPEASDVGEGRLANREAIAAVYNRLNGSAEKERLQRAANQYRLALDHWRAGAEALALAHLWIAIEALTKVQLRSVHRERGTSTDEKLATTMGVPLKELDATIRKVHLLRGDEECYSKAKRASDGFEHGYLAFHEIHAHAAEVYERLAEHVRSAIFSLSELDQNTTRIVLSEPYDKPLGTWPLLKFIRGKLIGESADLAPPDQAYPFVKWRSSVSSCSVDPNGKMNTQFTGSLTPQLGEGISLQLSSIQIWRGGSGINLLPQVPSPLPQGSFEITSVSQKGRTQIGDTIVSVDEPINERWRRPIYAFLMNTNSIRHMALFWIHRLGGEQPYRVPRAPFSKHVRRIERLLQRAKVSKEIRDECRSCWAEALALDNVRERVCRGAPAPEGLVCFDDRTSEGAPVIDDPKKVAEVSDKAMQLAKRLAELLTKVAPLP
jgi:hypothetical protein